MIGGLEEKKELLLSKKQELLGQVEKVEQLKKCGFLTSDCDIYGDKGPSVLFPFRLRADGYQLDPQNMDDFSIDAIQSREPFSVLIRKAGKCGLYTKQIFEDRNALIENKDMNIPRGNLEPVVMPNKDRPVIFAFNHMFHDDILGTFTAADRHAYIVFGSLPQFYNSIDGILLDHQGVVLVNRKVKESRSASVSKSVALLNNGGNLAMAPEGVWNKSPNGLVLPLWDGIYRIAKESGALIIPIVHYIYDPTYQIKKKYNPLHTVIDDIIDPMDMTKEEVLGAIRDSFSTWHYLMMEKYGNTTRAELLRDYPDSQSAWEDMLLKRAATAAFYDLEAETSSDYIPKDFVSPIDVFLPLANMEINPYNAKDVLYAKRLVKEYQRNDFQHRF